MKESATVEFEFRGERFEVSRAAMRSMRVQRGMSLAKDPEKQSDAWWAIDTICMGRSEEYMMRIPEEDGSVGELGCSSEAFSAFMEAAGEAISKN